MGKFEVRLTNASGSDTRIYTHHSLSSALEDYDNYDSADKILAEFGQESMRQNETVGVELVCIKDEFRGVVININTYKARQ